MFNLNGPPHSRSEPSASVQSFQVIAQHREGRLRDKRLRRVYSQELAPISSFDETTLEAKLHEIKAALSKKADAGELQALVQLRQLVTTAGDAAVFGAHIEKADRILESILAAKLIPMLIANLLPKQDTEMHRKVAFESCWALSNLAALEHKYGQHVINAAPVFIAHLSAGFGIAMAEQSAWALGNLAGDCQEFRSRLLANGALLPAARLAMRARFKSEGPAVTAAAQTAIWALCNLIKSSGSEVKELVSLEHFKPALLEILGRQDAPELVTEAAWLMSFICASPQSQFSAEEILPLLFANLAAALQQIGEKQESQLPGVLTPTLRSIGSLTASGSQATLSTFFAAEAGRSVQLIMQCSCSEQHGVAKEATWVLSNLAALRSPTSREPLLHGTGGPALLARLLAEGTFPIRKEAAYGVANLLFLDGALLPVLVGASFEEVPNGLLPSFASLAETADTEAVGLALQVFSRLMQELPHGAEMVESVNGIDILEQQQIRGSPENSRFATELLERYFGLEYGL